MQDVQTRQEAFGQRGMTLVERFGVYLSQGPIKRVVHCYHDPTILDIGCGYHAQMLCNLLPMIKQGMGIDMCISNNAKAQPKLTFYEQPVEQILPLLEPETFDIVTMISVLEHLWDPLKILAVCRSLLRPGGVLILNVPNWLGKWFLELSSFRLGFSGPDEIDDHKMYYDKRDLWPLLVRAGFRSSRIHMRYHKFRLNLFATAVKEVGVEKGSSLQPLRSD